MQREAQRDDTDLIAAFLADDRRAHRTIDSWIDAVLQDGFHSIRDRWDDVRQDARLRIFGCLQGGRFDGASSLRTYVHRIATNTAIDHLRTDYRDRRHSVSAADARGTEAVASRDHGPAVMARELLERLLGGLSAGERDLLDMIFTQNLAYAEVAQRLGISEAAVKLRVFRCRGHLLKHRRSLIGSERLPR